MTKINDVAESFLTEEQKVVREAADKWAKIAGDEWWETGASLFEVAKSAFKAGVAWQKSRQ